jgi:hypothetical protein
MADLADAVETKPDGKFFKRVYDWLNSGEKAPEKPAPPKAPEKPASDLDQASDKAWGMWTQLQDEARGLGIDLTNYSPTRTIATRELRAMYQELQVMVKDAKETK